MPSSPTLALGVPPAQHTGNLAASAPTPRENLFEEDRYFDSYTVQLTAGTAYLIKASRAQFDLLLMLTDDAGNELLSSFDDLAHGEGIQLRYVAPVSGTYHIIVSSLDGDEEGSYDLEVNTIDSFAKAGGVLEDTLAQPAEGVLVTAYLAEIIEGETEYVPQISTLTAADGSYELAPLIPGDYKITFRDLSHAFCDAFYQDASSFDVATIVTLPANSDVSLGISTLIRTGSFSGTVTDDTNTLLDEVKVSAYTVLADGELFEVASTETTESGTYRLSGLEPGSYIVRFRDSQGYFMQQFYNSAETTDTATPITAVSDADQADIDAVLVPAAHISGGVTTTSARPIPEISVMLRRLIDGGDPVLIDDYEIVAQTQTDEDGSYYFGWLDSGTYFLQFIDDSGFYLDAFYDGAVHVSSATPIDAVRGTRYGNADIILTASSRISGTVENASSLSIVGITVELFSFFDLDTPIAETYTNLAGEYLFYGVSPGTYALRFMDASGKYLTQHYSATLTPGDITPIPLLEETDRTGLSTILHEASTIKGSLQDIESGLPLGGVPIQLLSGSATSTAAFETTTDSNGRFALDGLAGGTYYLAYNHPTRGFQFYEEKLQAADADAITLLFGETQDLGILRYLSVPTVTVAFDPNNGENVQNMVYAKDSTVSRFPIVMRAGHRFLGWYDAPEGGDAVEAPKAFSVDTTLTARWEILTFTYTFNSQGGTPVDSRDYTYGDIVGELEGSARPGYDFLGWFTSPAGSSQVLSGQSVTSNRTLYARWRERKSTVTFDSQGGRAIAPLMVPFGDAVGALPTPFREGHAFIGWFDSPSGGAQVSSDFVIETDTILYAEWQRDRRWQ